MGRNVNKHSRICMPHIKGLQRLIETYICSNSEQLQT